MRDSALKPMRWRENVRTSFRVGEELMRDSALKPTTFAATSTRAISSEKSSCATAL